MKRLVAGGFAAAVVAALAGVSVPSGADALAPARSAATHTSAGRPASPHARAAQAADRLVASRPRVLEAGRFDGFQARPVVSSHGLQYVPYDRTFKGLPVVGGDFVVSTDAHGRVLGTTVAQSRPTRLSSVRPTVGRDRARQLSAARVDGAQVGTSRLVVLQRSASHLAWQTRVTGTRHGAPSVLDVYVDARDGRVLTTREHVAEGTGNGAWEGSVSIPTTLSGSTYSMKNPNAPTLTCADAATNVVFSGPDDVWGNGDATSRETGCVDAFYGAEQERQMLSTWLGRSGMNGSGGWVPIRVGLADVNAYYDGTQVQIGHTQTGSKWIGSIDVVAHELGHGVDDTTPGGISGGGTQEFVADTFGAATEWYANNPADAPDFTVGEEINLVGSGPIRYMYDPSLAGDANCYSAAVARGEVHAAAGPGNHWYYLMAEGTSPTNGQPTSPTCNGTSISGLGVQKAQQIMYNAMLMKTSTSSYLKYRTWTLTAAKNLFPGSCTEFNVVKAAWDAVSVPAQTADPTCSTGGTANTVTVTNPGSQTGSVGTAKSLQVKATDSASGQTLTYSATGLPAGESINAATGLISGTPTTSGNYSVTVKATDTTGAAGSASFSWRIKR